MKSPINVEETPERVVGRRRHAPDPWAGPHPGPEDARRWRAALGGVRVPRGVFRFATHEAAEAWLWQMITRQRPS
jgi:hypothetical protein